MILGASTLDQLDANLGAVDVQLSAEESGRLDVASDPGAADYLYGGRGTQQRSRRIEGGR